MSPPNLPVRFDSVDAVEDFMTAPSDALIADLAKTPGDIIVLGVGGKMGPTLARLAKRAAPSKRVMGVARFSEPGVREALDELLAADVKMAVLTNKPVLPARAICAHFGLDRFFFQNYGGNSFHTKKPVSGS